MTTGGLTVAGSKLFFSHREVTPTNTVYHIAVYDTLERPGHEYMNIESQSNEIRELLVDRG